MSLRKREEIQEVLRLQFAREALCARLQSDNDEKGLNMKLLFWRKEKGLKIEPRSLGIPRGKVVEFYKLYDEYIGKPNGADRLARFRLWEYIEHVFPETKKGRWKLEFKGAATVNIVEVLEEEK